MPKRDLKEYETLTYRVDLYFDQDDQVWVARYPDLPGCIGHGATKEKAIAKGDEMKSLWLETLLENGETPPEPQPEPAYSGKFVLRLPKTLHERAAQAAAREEVSLNQYLTSAIADRLGANDLCERLVEKLRHECVHHPQLLRSGVYPYTGVHTCMRDEPMEISDLLTLSGSGLLTAASGPHIPDFKWFPLEKKQTQSEGGHGRSY